MRLLACLPLCALLVADALPVAHRYAAQPLPGAEPAVFAPGLVSTGLPERDIAITPDGREIVFGLSAASDATLVHIRYQGGAWTGPEVLPFSRNPAWFDLEPAFSADGNRIFFLSSRPAAGEAEQPGWSRQRIWTASRTADGGWAAPELLPPAVNNGDSVFFPSLGREGALYFTRSKRGTRQTAVYRSPLAKGVFQEAERLPDSINGSSPYNAFVAPDERLMLFCSASRGDRLGPADYYVSFQDAPGSWSEPVNLGPTVNGPGRRATSAGLSPDGKLLFFASNRVQPELGRVQAGTRMSRLLELWGQPGNGLSDIYWVDAGFLDGLRRK